MAAARALLEKLTNEPERFYRERAVTSVYSLRARLTVFIKGENLDELFERSRIEQAKYIAQKIDDNWEVEPLPLVTTENGGIKPQFHQKNCLNLTKENPDLAIYPASAGAGKTVLSILDVLRQIDRGETGPLIIACPASLVPDYVSEIAYVTAGKLNPIAITTDVWDTHARNIKGSLRSIVKSAPINTVLVVSYRTLILGSYDVCYGQETITVYPVIQFLRSFRPTYALFDECHTLRNKTSKVHKGAMRLMAGCRKKRLASGTMVANTLQDLVGQISLIDPTLFGSEEEFKEKYMEVVEGTKGKKRKPRPGAETAVKNLLFSNMVIAAADRKQWAYKLPKQKRSFLAVQLTPLQQVTHDFILQTVFSAIAPKSPDAVGETMFYGAGAGGLPTGSSVVGDILQLIPNIHRGATTANLSKSLKLKKFLSPQMAKSGYFLRLTVVDTPGVLAKISSLFAKNKVSIQNTYQKTPQGKVAELVMILHPTQMRYFDKAISQIKKLAVVKKINAVIRIAEGL
jgi:predicted amino acid-binding ACT domain protein